MKTTYDAVNKFKGEWPYYEADNMIFCKLPYSVYELGDIEPYTCDEWSGLNLLNWRPLCRKQEFNDLVSQMETNFGECDPVLAAYYRHVTDKELLTKELEAMDIDWSKAPEHFDFYLENKMDKGNKGFCHYLNGSYVFLDGSRAIEGAFYVTEKPQPALTYTQAMADNGELPSVGMNVEAYKDRVVEIMLPFDSTRFTVGKCEDGEYALYSIGELKPLTPHIELIDGKAYQYSEEGLYSHGIYCDRAKAFGRVNYQVSIDECTNIQPLTVEVK